MDAGNIFPPVAIAGQMGRRLSIEIVGIDVIAGKPEENGVTDAIVTIGESAAVFMTNATGAGHRSTVIIVGNRGVRSCLYQGTSSA